MNVFRKLREILACLKIGEDIPRTDDFREALVEFEWSFAGVLAEIHPEWSHESLDAIFPAYARKTGELEAEIYGTCVLITDQARVPMHVHLQIDSASDEISWMELRIGAMLDGRMSQRRFKQRWIADVPESPKSFEWAYHVCYGTRRK